MAAFSYDIIFILTNAPAYDIICLEGVITMPFNPNKYIKEYNKDNYKMYQFRVRKDSDLIRVLDSKKNRNAYIVSLIDEDTNHSVLTIKEIKTIAKPILNKYGIREIFLFGSYSRGEATPSSDIDIYCEKGDIKTLIDVGQLTEELETALNKKVDIVFTTSTINPIFYEQIMEDMIKLC